MGKKLFSLCMALALCLSLLPATALAAAPGGQVIYVGNENVTSGGYWTTDSNGNVTAYTGGDTPTDNYIHYDVANNTLTLHNATIKESVSTNTSTFIAGAAIGVLNQNGDAELTITLEGTNTIAEVGKGIYVLANSTGGATLTITGDGSLDASASQTGIWVQSNSNNAALCVENAEVTASADGAVKNGVLVQAKDGSDVSLTVNGGSLTASVNANIWFQFGSGVSGSGTPTVTVSNNAIVRANGGIANTSSTSIQYGTGNKENGGIVWNGTGGTVYGDVELQEDLEIGEGESLTLDDGASLNTGNYTLTVNGGTLTGNVTGTVNYKVTGVSLDKTSLNLNPGKEGTLTATITPSNATNQNVTWKSSDTKVATVDNGLVTAVAEGTATITVTTADGGKTATCEVTVTQPAKTPVTSVTLDKTSLTLDVGDTETLTATVKPDNATNKAVTWSTSNKNVATVDQNGNVKAVGAGTATITAAASDGSGKTATCEVTVNGPVLPPQPSDPAPSQPEGSGSTGSSGSSAPRQQGPVVHNVSNSSAYRKGEYEFWMKVRTNIVSANPGEVIEVNARDNDKMPNSVMQALAAKEDVTLRVRWNDGEEIVIPSAAALQEKMRMFYPLSYLAKFDFAQTPAKKVK